MTALLELRGLSAGYDGTAVVHDVDLHVDPGEVVALLGANGAGKTTTLLAISGLVERQGGTVSIGGVDVGGRRPRLPGAVRLARTGVAHVPEDRGLFNDLSVLEHLRLGRRRGRAGLSDAEVYQRFPALEALAQRRAGLLSGGEQQMLALARALVSVPRLLLVDELSLGLAPLVVRELLPIVRQVVAETGAGVLLVEQHVGMALAVADRAYLLDRGQVVASGPAAELAAQADRLEAGYLGRDPG